MALDLTQVSIAEMKIDRMEFADDATLVGLKGDPNAASGYIPTVTFTQADNWAITDIENLYINVSFVRLQIQDYPGFEDILAETEFWMFEGIVYSMIRKHRPKGVNRVWSFRLEPVNEFPITI